MEISKYYTTDDFIRYGVMIMVFVVAVVVLAAIPVLAYTTS